MPGSTAASMRAPSKAQVQDAIGAGLARAVRTAGGQGSLADRIETSPDTIRRALSGETTPQPHVLIGSLIAEPTALNEALALVGLTATPLRAEPANDMTLLSRLTGAGADVAQMLLDGLLCHRDQAALAERFRALIPMMQAVVDAADRRAA